MDFPPLFYFLSMKKFLVVFLSSIIFLGFGAKELMASSSNSEPTKIGIIVETKDAEKSWNAFRFAIAARNQGCEVKVFLMGEGVECETVSEKTYNVGEKMNEFVKAGGEIFACGTCLKTRQMNGTDVCPMSNMKTCVEIVLWADKMLTF